MMMTLPNDRRFRGLGSQMVVVLYVHAFVLWSKISAVSAWATTRGASSSSLLPLQISSLSRARVGCCSFVDPSASDRKYHGSSQNYFRRGSIIAGGGRRKSGSSGMLYMSDTDYWSPDIVDVPLVFVPGMKGTHLAFENEEANTQPKKRAWLTLGNLLNFPPAPDNDPERDISLPLTYDYDPPPSSQEVDEDGNEVVDESSSSRHYPRQHEGKLVTDGIVDHIIEWNLGDSFDVPLTKNYADLDLLPFYGHPARMLRKMDKEYHARKHDGKVESSKSFQNQETENDDDDECEINFDEEAIDEICTGKKAIPDRQSRLASRHCRPTAVFSYDWRRPLPEISDAFHEFCEETFPDQPVQVVAHSLGGLMAFDAMRKHPEKYAPGAVVVGVPFKTGVQFLIDLQKGWSPVLDRCRQFTPEKVFTMASHWIFFPTSADICENRFVDITERCKDGQDIKFESDEYGALTTEECQPSIGGDNAYFDFYDVDEWERLDMGVFGPEYDNLLTDEQRQQYREHMRIQLAAAKKWRRTVLGEGMDKEEYKTQTFVPPLVACSTNAIPTTNQFLRRKRYISSTQNAKTRKGRSPLNPYEYDYRNGRSVPGDGGLDYDRCFPPSFVSHKRVTLDSSHANQMCWEENGGSWGRIYEEVIEQAEEYLRLVRKKEKEIEEMEKERASFQAMISLEETKEMERRRQVLKKMGFFGGDTSLEEMENDCLDTSLEQIAKDCADTSLEETERRRTVVESMGFSSDE
mmetsp:Transcript_31144/g.57770  ORF Transcript_31144/g.57770 Transcript_31144/m.57770 type:complete len:747 (+) Transcript_31144:55-2295(+)